MQNVKCEGQGKDAVIHRIGIVSENKGDFTREWGFINGMKTVIIKVEKSLIDIVPCDHMLGLLQKLDIHFIYFADIQAPSFLCRQAIKLQKINGIDQHVAVGILQKDGDFMRVMRCAFVALCGEILVNGRVGVVLNTDFHGNGLSVFEVQIFSDDIASIAVKYDL